MKSKPSTEQPNLKANWKVFTVSGKDLQDRLNVLTATWNNFHVHSILPTGSKYRIVMHRTCITKPLTTTRLHEPTRRNLA